MNTSPESKIEFKHKIMDYAWNTNILFWSLYLIKHTIKQTNKRKTFLFKKKGKKKKKIKSIKTPSNNFHVAKEQFNRPIYDS